MQDSEELAQELAASLARCVCAWVPGWGMCGLGGAFGRAHGGAVCMPVYSCVHMETTPWAGRWEAGRKTGLVWL